MSRFPEAGRCCFTTSRRKPRQRTLELTIRLNADGFEVDVYEPESGEIKELQHPYMPDEHPDFDKSIGDEIYSWLSLWYDEEGDRT